MLGQPTKISFESRNVLFQPFLSVDFFIHSCCWRDLYFKSKNFLGLASFVENCADIISFKLVPNIDFEPFSKQPIRSPPQQANERRGFENGPRVKCLASDDI